MTRVLNTVPVLASLCLLGCVCVLAHALFTRNALQDEAASARRSADFQAERLSALRHDAPTLRLVHEQLHAWPHAAADTRAQALTLIRVLREHAQALGLANPAFELSSPRPLPHASGASVLFASAMRTRLDLARTTDLLEWLDRLGTDPRARAIAQTCHLVRSPGEGLLNAECGLEWLFRTPANTEDAVR